MGLRLFAEGSSSRMSPFWMRDAEIDLERPVSYAVDENRGILDGGDPFQDLRKAMLHHEQVFQSQVLELHRLYRTQKNLMDGVAVDGYGSCSRPCLGMPMQVPKKAMLDRTFFAHRPTMTVDTCKTAMDFSYRLRPDCQRMFNVQCSSDEYIGSMGDRCLLGNVSTSDEIILDRKESEFALGYLKDYDDRSRKAVKSFSHKQGLNPQEVINLDDSSEMQIDEDSTIVSSSGMKAPILCLETKNKSILHGLSDKNSSEKSGEYLGSPHSKYLPFSGPEISCTKSGSLFTTKQQQSTQMDAPFDLNIAQPEDQPVIAANTHVSITSLSVSSVASIYATEDESLASNAKEIHSTIKGNDFLSNGHERRDSGQNCVVVGSSSSHNSNSMVLNETLGSDAKVSLQLNSAISGEHYTEFAETSSNLHNLTTKGIDLYTEKEVSGSDSKKSDTNFQSLFGTTNLPSSLIVGLEAKQVELENSDEDTVSSKIHGDHKVQINMSNLFKQHPGQPEQFSKSMTVFNNLHNTGCRDLKNGALPRIVQKSQITNIDTSCAVSRSSPENAGTLTCGIICPDGKFCGHHDLHSSEQFSLKKQQVSERDDVVLMAAQCLTFISSKSLNLSPCGFNEVQNSGLVAEDMGDQPQCSSDSLELIILSLPENQEDECSMRARPMEEEPVKNAVRFNSRRGRQLRDFQKDILPGLASLSRHEICEDMHAFTEIARLHEIKKKETRGNICRRNRSTIVRKRRSRCH